MSTCTHLIQSVCVDKVLAERQEAMDSFAAAMALMSEARSKISVVMGKDCSVAMNDVFYNALIVAGDAEKCGNVMARKMDVKVWARLMDESGMYSIMSHKQRDVWETTLYSDNMPPATRENVASTFAGLYQDRDTVYREGIIEVFRQLSWDYKSNNPVMIGKKIIKEGFFEPSRCYYSVSSRFIEKLDDLARAFYLFDKKPLPDHRSGVGQQLSDYFTQNGFNGVPFENEYFIIKYFMKGSVHITFKRPDIVDSLNDLIAEAYPDALAAPR